jgi:energy-converting hydrogenase Eha subunit A
VLPSQDVYLYNQTIFPSHVKGLGVDVVLINVGVTERPQASVIVINVGATAALGQDTVELPFAGGTNPTE